MPLPLACLPAHLHLPATPLCPAFALCHLVPATYHFMPLPTPTHVHFTFACLTFLACCYLPLPTFSSVALFTLMPTCLYLVCHTFISSLYSFPFPLLFSFCGLLPPSCTPVLTFAVPHSLPLFTLLVGSLMQTVCVLYPHVCCHTFLFYTHLWLLVLPSHTYTHTTFYLTWLVVTTLAVTFGYLCLVHGSFWLVLCCCIFILPLPHTALLPLYYHTRTHALLPFALFVPSPFALYLAFGWVYFVLVTCSSSIHPFSLCLTLPSHLRWFTVVPLPLPFILAFAGSLLPHAHTHTHTLYTPPLCILPLPLRFSRPLRSVYLCPLRLRFVWFVTPLHGSAVYIHLLRTFICLCNTFTYFMHCLLPLVRPLPLFCICLLPPLYYTRATHTPLPHILLRLLFHPLVGYSSHICVPFCAFCDTLYLFFLPTTFCYLLYLGSLLIVLPFSFSFSFMHYFYLFLFVSLRLLLAFGSLSLLLVARCVVARARACHACRLHLCLFAVAYCCRHAHLPCVIFTRVYAFLRVCTHATVYTTHIFTRTRTLLPLCVAPCPTPGICPLCLCPLPHVAFAFLVRLVLGSCCGSVWLVRGSFCTTLFTHRTPFTQLVTRYFAAGAIAATSPLRCVCAVPRRDKTHTRLLPPPTRAHHRTTRSFCRRFTDHHTPALPVPRCQRWFFSHCWFLDSRTTYTSYTTNIHTHYTDLRCFTIPHRVTPLCLRAARAFVHAFALRCVLLFDVVVVVGHLLCTQHYKTTLHTFYRPIPTYSCTFTTLHFTPYTHCTALRLRSYNLTTFGSYLLLCHTHTHTRLPHTHTHWVLILALALPCPLCLPPLFLFCGSCLPLCLPLPHTLSFPFVPLPCPFAFVCLVPPATPCMPLLPATSLFVCLFAFAFAFLHSYLPHTTHTPPDAYLHCYSYSSSYLVPCCTTTCLFTHFILPYFYLGSLPVTYSITATLYSVCTRRIHTAPHTCTLPFAFCYALPAPPYRDPTPTHHRYNPLPPRIARLVTLIALTTFVLPPRAAVVRYHFTIVVVIYRCRATLHAFALLFLRAYRWRFCGSATAFCTHAVCLHALPPTV